MVESTQSIWMVMSVVVAFIFYLQRYKFFSILGPSILCILFGMALGNLGIMPHWHDAYGVIVTYAIPLAIGIYLININLKEVLSISAKPLLALILAMFCVTLMAFLGGLLFSNAIPEIWKFTGMFIGTYTGGSANLTAVGTALDATPGQLAAANASDYVVGMPVLILLFMVPRIVLNSDWLQKKIRYKLPDSEVDSDEEPELFKPRVWSVVDLATLVGVGFLLMTLGDFVASYVPKEMASAAKILTITTLAVILGQIPSIQKIKGNTEVGIYFSSFFLVVIGFLINIEDFVTSLPEISMYCGLVLFGSIILYVILGTLFKLPYQYMLIAYAASMADGTTAAIISATNKWRSLVSIAILLGAIGFVLGNYLGIFVAYGVRFLLG